MRRREFITLLGGAAASWSHTVRAQQPMPVVGFLDAGSAAERTPQVAAFRKGLAEAAYRRSFPLILTRFSSSEMRCGVPCNCFHISTRSRAFSVSSAKSMAVTSHRELSSLNGRIQV
jgi:hypothetical protein